MTRTTSARSILSSVLSFNKYLQRNANCETKQAKSGELSKFRCARNNAHLQATCTSSAAFSRISEFPTVLPADPAIKNMGSTTLDLPSLYDGRISGKQDITPCSAE